MALAKEDIEQIQTLIQSALDSRQSFEAVDVRYDLDLRERAVRVEEELKHQRQLMIQGFEQMEKRFEQMEKRFEQVDKRFEAVDKRFEQVDKRFEVIDKRFEQVDKRFEQVDKHFEMLTQRLDRFMFWSLGLTITASGTVIAALRIWLP